jgi:hypothetical protein
VREERRREGIGEAVMLAVERAVAAAATARSA